MPEENKEKEKKEPKKRKYSRWFYRDSYEEDQKIKEAMSRCVDWKAFWRDRI